MEVTQGGGGSSDKVKVKPKTGSVFFEYQSAEIDPMPPVRPVLLYDSYLTARPPKNATKTCLYLTLLVGDAGL